MSIIVVFYSRYSTDSLQYLETLEKIMEVRKLCIDNEEVRDRIVMEKENYNIEYVPSTLIFHSNGFMEKHAGTQSCLQWLEKITPKRDEIPIPKKEIEEVRPVEKIPIDDIEFEPRRMDTSPLIKKTEDTKLNKDSNENIEEKIKEDRESQAQNNMKKNNTNDSILSIAQQMQKQREQEVKDS